MSNSNNINENRKAQEQLLNDAELVDPDAGRPEVVFDGEQTELSLVSAILKDATVLEFCRAVVSPANFEDRANAKIVETAYRLADEHGELPSRRLFTDELKRQLKGVTALPWYMGRLISAYDYIDPTVADKRHLRDVACEVARRSIVKKATGDLLDGFQRGKVNIPKAIKAFQEAEGITPVPSETATFGIGDRIDVTRPEWLISPLLRKNTSCVLFGESGSRKTWLAIDLALSVATGRAFLDHFSVKQGKVLYVISEGADDFELRCMAWCKQKGVSAPDVSQFAYRPGSYDFGEEQAVALICEHIKERLGSADLIIVDTLSKNFGGDADSNEGMTAFLNGIERLRADTGATVLVIHHTGWTNTERERGGRALRDNADTSILCKKEGDGSTLVCKKQKLGQAFGEIPVTFELVRLPEYDTADEEMTALVGKYDTATDETILEVLDSAFAVAEQYTQQELVAYLREMWPGTAPGDKKARKMIQQQIGQTICRESQAGKYIYRRMSLQQ